MIWRGCGGEVVVVMGVWGTEIVQWSDSVSGEVVQRSELLQIRKELRLMRGGFLEDGSRE